MTDPAPPSSSHSRKPLDIGLAIVGATVLLLATRRAAIQSSNGNWGGAVGVLIGPFVWYVIVQSVSTFIARRLAGRPHTRFATSRLNYATTALVVLALLAVLSQPV